MMVLNRALLSSIRFWNDISVHEEATMMNRFEGSKSGKWSAVELNSHLIVALSQDLVVLAERHEENDGRDVLKAVDPLPPLWPLTTDIHHPAVTTANPNNRRRVPCHKLPVMEVPVYQTWGITCCVGALYLTWKWHSPCQTGIRWCPWSELGLWGCPEGRVRKTAVKFDPGQWDSWKNVQK